MISNSSQINIYNEAKLLKEVKSLRKKIADSKVGKASSQFGDERSLKFNSELKKYRADYQQSLNSLKKVQKLKNNRKRELNLEAKEITNRTRKAELKEYQEKSDGSYSYISNFNSSKKINTNINKKSIFNIYI